METSKAFLKDCVLALAKEYYTIPHDVERLPVRESLSRSYPEFLELSNLFCEEDTDFKEQFELIRRLHGRKYLECYIDGGVRQPEPHITAAAASAYVLKTNGEIVQKDAFRVPPYHGKDGVYAEEASDDVQLVSSHATEYEALNMCLRTLIHTNMDIYRMRMTVFTDSQLLYNQMRGTNRTRIEQISRLMTEARFLISQFENVDIIWIPREKNEVANSLVQSCLNADTPKRI